MPPATITPFHLSERNFRRFEPIICEALRAFPDVVTKNPADYPSLARATFVARLRDAISSWPAFRWTIDFSSPELIPELVVASLPNGHILIGPHHAIRTFKAQGLKAETFSASPEASTAKDLTTWLLTPFDLSLLCRLAADHLLACPLRLRLSHETIELSESAGHDIDLAPQGENIYILT